MSTLIEAETTQASAICPTCGGEVFSDRLTLTQYELRPDGTQRPTRLIIDCPHCGYRATVRIIRY